MHHISKHLKTLMRVLSYFVSMLLIDAISTLPYFPWLHLFLHRASFLPSFFLRLLYLWVWFSMISLMLRLVLLIIFPEALCVYVLTCTILVGKLNKIFGLVTQTIKSLHGIYCLVFKNMCFWCDTKYKLLPGLHGGSNKSSCLSDTLTGWVNLM